MNKGQNKLTKVKSIYLSSDEDTLTLMILRINNFYKTKREGHNNLISQIYKTKVNKSSQIKAHHKKI